MDSEQLNTGSITDWRSIVTLVVFVLTNLVVLFPFHLPLYCPHQVQRAILRALDTLRIVSATPPPPPPPPQRDGTHDSSSSSTARGKTKNHVLLPMNLVTAPIAACLFLLAISAIGRQEVKAGTIGADNVHPLDVMLFFITLAYIAISIDSAGAIRWLSYKVLRWGGNNGHRLFLYLYAFFTVVGGFIGNDPIVLSGTPFLAYMTRISSNIKDPRAWIFTQFSIANIVSAILVSSNPTNLVLAGAFQIRYIEYTANMIVPVLFTVVLLFPILLYVVFRNESLIPKVIMRHELPPGIEDKAPINPCIPFSRQVTEEMVDSVCNGESHADKGRVMDRVEIMHPFLDKKGAIFGAVLMAVTLITVLVLNAANPTDGELPVFWVTVPAAVVMFVWDIVWGWLQRKASRELVSQGRQIMAQGRDEEPLQQPEAAETETGIGTGTGTGTDTDTNTHEMQILSLREGRSDGSEKGRDSAGHKSETVPEQDITSSPRTIYAAQGNSAPSDKPLPTGAATSDHPEDRDGHKDQRQNLEKTTLATLVAQGWAWARETFPTVTFVLNHLPLALVPFAFAMFILVQGLVTKGWVPVFARGWDAWVNRTGTIGAIGGMGFLSVVFSNFAGTNIGTTILMCRILQAWQAIHEEQGTPITNRTFWASVYSMALGVNYGAFSTAFSASLAGLLWKDILERKGMKIRARDFARYNVPIITVSMVIGCSVLIGEVYLFRDTKPYRMDE